MEVYEVDPFLCPRCGGTMEVVAVIERPAVVRQILDHLAGPAAAPSLRAPPDGRVAAHSRDWSYQPLFDDLPVPEPVTV